METSERERHWPPDRQLYALLHLSPEASDDDVKRAFRHWAQIYHPDKHQTLQMQDAATQNFQKIREAYEILSDERKRQVYDVYGMEGLTSGLELGPKLKSRHEVRAEFERLQQRQEESRLAAHVHHRGSLLMNLSLLPVLESYDPLSMSGMAMTTLVQAQVSKRDTVMLGGNMALRSGLGRGSVTMGLRRQLSPISTVEFLAMAGLRSILSLQTSRQLSTHSRGTLGLSVSLRDGSVTLANNWSRLLTEDTTGNIQLVIGSDTGISVGLRKYGKKNAGSADVKVGPTTFGVSGQYIRHFSSKSQGRLSGKIGSTGVEVKVGGERRLSEHSSAAMFCVLGLQGVSWKVRFTRGGQKFVLPIMLCPTLNPYIAAGALIMPSSIYAILKTFVFQPYNLRRNRRKSLELRRATYTQVIEARASSEKSQLLLKNVAERKKQKQAQRQGLVVLAAVYGDIREYELEINCVDKSASTEDNDADLPPPYLDVAIPLQFLVDDLGRLQLHEGISKAGLMGFCDPCPGKSKQLKVAYSYSGCQHEVVVGDFDELKIPQEAHRIQHSSSENLDQRSSFWLQYGRLRQHLQACDLLLEQINARAVLPGRHKVDVPTRIDRGVQYKHVPGLLCEVPSHVTRASPFDVALNLRFNPPENVDSYHSCRDELKLPDPSVCTPISETQVSISAKESSQIQLPDIICTELETCENSDLASENFEFGHSNCSGPLVPCSLENVASLAVNDFPVSAVNEDEARGSSFIPNSSPQLPTVSATSASCIVERPSIPQPVSTSTMAGRTSFCRIEAFVVRSKSVRSIPAQQYERTSKSMK